jgi:hypothetical protein
MTIFYVWSGEQLAAHTSGIGGFGRCLWGSYGTQDFGTVEAPGAHVRSLLDAHHDDITVLPGVNGRLNATQASAIQPSFPEAVEGMPMRDVLSAIYSATSWEPMNPDNY